MMVSRRLTAFNWEFREFIGGISAKNTNPRRLKHMNAEGIYVHDVSAQPPYAVALFESDKILVSFLYEQPAATSTDNTPTAGLGESSTKKTRIFHR